MFTILSEHFEFRHFRPHYLDVDTIFGDLRRECLHQHVVRNTILRKPPPSVVSGYGKRSINLIVRQEMTKFKMFREYSKHGFLFCGNYILKYWKVMKTCYNNGQKERL
jgi:hypothetical protein